MTTKRVLTFALSFLVLASAFTSTIGEEEFVCPITDTKFKFKVQYSYSTFGKNLDLKPFGAAIIPTPIPKCPDCGFVFSKNFFTEGEIVTLRDHLKTNEINNFKLELPNYYYLAEEMLIVHRHADDVAWRFVQSVWENKKRENFNFLASKTIQSFDMLDKESEFYKTTQLIKIDFLRRMGKFKEAAQTIETVKTDKTFYKDYIVKIIDYQMLLISKKDTDEHKLPE